MAECAALLRKEAPSARMVLGGPGASLFPDALLAATGADWVLIPEEEMDARWHYRLCYHRMA